MDASRHPAGRNLRLLNAALHGGFTQRLAGLWTEGWQMAMRLHLALLGTRTLGELEEASGIEGSCLT